MEHILIVEDDLNLQETLLDIFELKGFQVSSADNGKEAIEAIEYEKPSLIISDVMMPVMDGFELVEHLKKNSSTELIPVILLTANAMMEAKLKGLEYGATDYITKPFEARELVLKVANILKERKKLTQSILTTPALDEPISEDEAFLRNLRNVVDEHLDTPKLSVDKLAGLLFISKSTLQRRIKRIAGKNANEFVNDYKMECAKQMLENRVGNASEVAKRVGFSSLSYFSQSFKKHYGVNPKALIKR